MEIVASTEDFEIGVLPGGGALVQRVVPVTFSAWNAGGEGAFFEAEFFRKRGWTACFVRARRNHWWHCDGLPEALEALAAAHGRIFLYGASMGGYGALYHSRMLDLTCLTFSPQVAVAPEAIPKDARWLDERRAVAPVFDEDAVLAAPRTAPAFCVFDEAHGLDGLHARRLRERAGPESGIAVIDAPYTFHQTIRAAQQGGLLELLLSGLCAGAVIDPDGLRAACATIHASTVKGRADALRRRGAPTRAQVEALLREVDTKRCDFEEAYMVAELCSAVGLSKEALALSWRSVDLNVADYVLVKHARLLMKHMGAEAALLALSLYADHRNYGRQSAALAKLLRETVEAA
jgi:hypothetical protein